MEGAIPQCVDEVTEPTAVYEAPARGTKRARRSGRRDQTRTGGDLRLGAGVRGAGSGAIHAARVVRRGGTGTAAVAVVAAAGPPAAPAAPTAAAVRHDRSRRQRYRQLGLEMADARSVGSSMHLAGEELSCELVSSLAAPRAVGKVLLFARRSSCRQVEGIPCRRGNSVTLGFPHGAPGAGVCAVFRRVRRWGGHLNGGGERVWFRRHAKGIPVHQRVRAGHDHGGPDAGSPQERLRSGHATLNETPDAPRKRARRAGQRFFPEVM